MNTRLKVKDKSTLTSEQCIVEYIMWFVVCFIDYRVFLFISLDNHTIYESQLILIISMVIFSIIGCIIRWKRCLTTISVLADIIVGSGIYTMMAYKSFYKKWFAMLILIYGIVVFLYIGYIFTRKIKGKSVFAIKNPKRKAFILKNRIRKVLSTMGLYMGIMMIFIMIPILYNRITYNGIMKADIISSTNDYDINYINGKSKLEYNLDTIEKIRENSRWQPLSMEEKLKVLQAVCDCEANYLGLDYQVMVVMDDLKESIHGKYNHMERIVIIDKQHLESDDAHQVLITCLHEMYHAFEHSLVQLYFNLTESQRKLRIFESCEKYIDEIQNYEDGENDEESFMKYYYQSMEMDSRDYSRERLFDYYYEIDKLQANYDKYQGSILDSYSEDANF